jgi:uncharacterized membrane protein YbhN (UPF0104 family)
MLQEIGFRIPVSAFWVVLVLLWILLLVVYEKIVPSPTTGRKYLILVSSLLAWVFLGLSFGFILPEFSPHSGFYVIGIYALGWIAGYITIFAPGGLGIRESVLVLLLGSMIEPELAIVYASIHRFMFIIAEIFLGVVSLGLGFLPIYRNKEGAVLNSPRSD